MQDPQVYHTIALAGVPNVGKSTIFNALTGLNQKVGNYPGITVDKKTGTFRQPGLSPVQIIDLPGTYNLYPQSEDEQVVFRVLCGLEPNTEAQAVLVIADQSNLERGLFLASQLIDLAYPTALVLNMEDQARMEGFDVNKTLLSRLLGVPIYTTAADKGTGIGELKQGIATGRFTVGRSGIDLSEICDSELIQEVQRATGIEQPYRALQMLKFREEGNRVDQELRSRLSALAGKYGFDSVGAQRKETALRYEKVRDILSKCLQNTGQKQVNTTLKLDKVLLNPYWGFAIFLALLFVMFQSIFTWAQGPMELIDKFFAMLSFETARMLPSGALTDLLSEGIIPGLGGVVIFVPQIALLFAFLAILEGSGYMARAVFITDKVMRPFGLNGRSVVPLISGFACAIPAIMAARSIANRRDKMITIFVTPFMSCSARLPVYIVLIGLIIPSGDFAFMDQRGIALFLMYLLGIAAALLSALGMKIIMKKEAGGTLVLELPRYRLPNLKTVLLTMYEKANTFVFEAGKVILAISIVLWVLASYGPGERLDHAVAAVQKPESDTPEMVAHYELSVNTARLEASYAGILGKFIEPAIRPLGFDWKVGIALITSFAAREVFVSTINTLYSIGSDDEDYTTIQQRLSKEVNPSTGKPFFSEAVVWSLLVFYALAMQCMSTVAVVYRETKSWKWPAIQTVYMTVVAYISSLLVFQLLS